MVTECVMCIRVVLFLLGLVLWPGFVLQRIFVPSKDFLETIVFSIGFGLAFLALLCPVLDLVWNISLVSVSFCVVCMSGLLFFRPFKRLQIVSTFLFSITDATNDAQKIMGIITVLLMYYGHLTEFSVPLWVVLISYVTISMGTLFAGWRIVKTMAKNITLIKPYQGFCSDFGSSIMLGVAAAWGMPVSSTHVANGTIIGTGLTRGVKAVKWKTIRNIIWAWILSAPVSAIFSFLIYKGIELMI